MRVLVILGVLILNIVVQSCVFPFLSIFGTKPDTLSAIVVSFALQSGNPTGAIVGFLGGLMQDVFFGEVIGIYALQYMVIGYLVGLFYEKLSVGRLILPLIFVGCACFVKGFVMYIYLFFIRVEMSVYEILFRKTLPEMIYTWVLMPVIYHYVTRLYRMRFMMRKWRISRHR